MTIEEFLKTAVAVNAVNALKSIDNLKEVSKSLERIANSIAAIEKHLSKLAERR
jgi:hypothetical protein